jgi:hypothetical protein
MHECMGRIIPTVTHRATVGMHPAQSWRDGWDDGRNGLPYNEGHYKDDSALLYGDGYNVGSIRRRELNGNKDRPAR